MGRTVRSGMVGRAGILRAARTGTVGTGLVGKSKLGAPGVAGVPKLRAGRRAGEPKLPASSVVETIVASLVFMLVFAASMYTLSRFGLRPDEGRVLIEAERAIDECLARYTGGTNGEGTHSGEIYGDGTRTDTFEWGEVTTRITRYGDYDDVVLVVVCASIAGSRKTIETRVLVVEKHE